MIVKKWLFPAVSAVLLTAGAVLRSKLLSHLQYLYAVHYEYGWAIVRWSLAFVTEIAFGFVLCLLVTHGVRRLRRFSAVHFILSLLLVGCYWAAQLGILYPTVTPADQSFTVILNTLAGVLLFQTFFRMESRTTQTGWEK